MAPTGVIGLATDYAQAEVRLAAGLISNVQLRVGDQWVEPLAVAPWSQDSAETDQAKLPYFLRRLGGLFFCLPFGGKAVPASSVTEWRQLSSIAQDPVLHGATSNMHWSLNARSACSTTIELLLEDPHPVRRVVQTITCAQDRPEITTDINIDVRVPTKQPIGFHPILKLPPDKGALHIEARFDRGWVYPSSLGPNSRTLPGASFKSLQKVPGRSGFLDLSQLPPTRQAAQELLMFCRAVPPITATFRESRYAVEIDWDETMLPHCLVWLEDRATMEAPWYGSFRGLGIEPIASAFDFSTAVSAGTNPITLAGEKTAVEMNPGKPTRLWCRITASAKN